MRCEGETVGIYAFPSKKARFFNPPAGRKFAKKMKFLNMFMVTTIVRAGKDGEEIVESYCQSDRSIDTLVDCDENEFSWEQEIQAPSRKGNYEFRIIGYWSGEADVEPGTPHTPDSHVLGTWNSIVE